MPAARNSSSTGGGRARVSPSRKPPSSARSVGGSTAPPRTTIERSALATGRRTPPGGRNDTISVASKRATAWRQRSRSSNPSSGRSQPESTTWSPAAEDAEAGCGVTVSGDEDGPAAGVTPRPVVEPEPLDASKRARGEARAVRILDQRGVDGRVGPGDDRRAQR